MVRIDSGILEKNTNNTNKRKHKNKGKQWRKMKEEADGGSRQTLMVRSDSGIKKKGKIKIANLDIQTLQYKKYGGKARMLMQVHTTQGWYAVTLHSGKERKKHKLYMLKNKAGYTVTSIFLENTNFDYICSSKNTRQIKEKN